MSCQLYNKEYMMILMMRTNKPHIDQVLPSKARDPIFMAKSHSRAKVRARVPYWNGEKT